jgi:RNA polymerase sigma-70 factor, ECF subfamily
LTEFRRTSTPTSALALAAVSDDEALARLVRTYHDRVYRFGVRVCRDSFDADDAVQEAFAKLARRSDLVRDPSALSWLFTVVRNTCSRLLRPFLRERRTLGERIADAHDAHGPDAVLSEELDPEQALERWRLVESVHAAIGTLTSRHREVLVLRDLEGLSGPETCAVLGLTEATMKTRLHQARAELRRSLERSAAGSTSAATR